MDIRFGRDKRFCSCYLGQNLVDHEKFPLGIAYSEGIMGELSVHDQPDSQDLQLRYPRYGEDPDTGWSPGTQILGA